MSTRHDADQKDTDEREAAGEEYVTRDALKVAVLKHKDGCDLREKVDTMHSGFVDMAATIRTWGRAFGALLAVLTLTVGVLTYISATRGQGGQSHMVPQAHAETKGTP